MPNIDAPVMRGPRPRAYVKPRRRQNEAELARRYATSQLGMLSKAGLSDETGSLGIAAQAGMAGEDPAAAWRDLSARMMALHAASNPEGPMADPRVWLKQQIANRPAAMQDQQARVLARLGELQGADAPILSEQSQSRATRMAPIIAQAQKRARARPPRVPRRGIRTAE